MIKSAAAYDLSVRGQGVHPETESPFKQESKSCFRFIDKGIKIQLSYTVRAWISSQHSQIIAEKFTTSKMKQNHIIERM